MREWLQRVLRTGDHESEGNVDDQEQSGSSGPPGQATSPPISPRVGAPAGPEEHPSPPEPTLAAAGSDAPAEEGTGDTATPFLAPVTTVSDPAASSESGGEQSTVVPPRERSGQEADLLGDESTAAEPPLPRAEVPVEDEDEAEDDGGTLDREPPSSPTLLEALEQRGETSESEGATPRAPAPRTTDELAAPALRAISRGTVVGDRYTIISDPQSEGADDATGEVRYLVTDALAYQQCWSCGSRDNSAGMRFCQSCGAGLLDHPVVMASTPAPTGQRGEFPGPTGYFHIVPQRRRFGAEGVVVQVGAYSAEGPHHPNEDSYWYALTSTCGNSRRESQGVFVFADGMGGYQPGSGLISRPAATAAGEALWASLLPYRLPDAEEPDDAEVERLVRLAIAAANTTVLSEIARAGYEMGCTLVVTVVLGETAYVANVGDSRAYYLSPTGDATQVTEDQSHVGALVAAGQLAPDAVYTAVGNNVILHAMGEEGVEDAAGWQVQPLEPTGALVLCSDGYWKTVRGVGRALDAIAEAPSLDEAARALVNDALDRGSDDNTTVVIVRAV